MFHVYIMASGRNGTLYIGMTDDLNRRVWEHQTGIRRGFTRQYGVKMLVWSEPHETREAAFARERAMKKWNRAWKLKLIEDGNPQCAISLWSSNLDGCVDGASRLLDPRIRGEERWRGQVHSPLIPAQAGI